MLIIAELVAVFNIFLLFDQLDDGSQPLKVRGVSEQSVLKVRVFPDSLDEVSAQAG